MNFKKLVKFDFDKFVPYKSARNMCVKGDIWLNANESPFRKQFITISKNLNRYPDPQPKNIIFKYAKYAGIKVDNILISRGIDESIELITKIFCKPFLDKIMYFPPTYDMYRISSEIFNVQSIKVFIKDYNDFDYNIIKKNLKFLKLIYICRPNNPTGDIMPEEVLINILNISCNNSLVIVDEAYIEFCLYKSVINLIEKYPNLIVLRTMSKAFGLAGARCGFSIANSKIIKILKTFIAPYPIPSPVCNIVEKSLRSSYIEFIKKAVLEINNNKNWLFKKLKRIKCIKKVFKTYANYILIKCFHSKHVLKKTNCSGIILRDQSEKLNLENCIRISVGTKLECKKLICQLKKISCKTSSII
ncbi:histidinol-phosphate transaminase [Buchnera aphidicola (Chaitoregma tattakana)]|uniref:histidinol-phosphate transaminase n=1 Tax=Buchnera aphidicola TaxID=9 RepID=UPI0031B84139